MKNWVMPIVRCPHCLSTLRVEAFERDKNDSIISGILICENTECRSWYPIINRIPRLIAEKFRRDITSEFVKIFESELAPMNILSSEQTLSSDHLTTLKENTIKSFGYEWNKYDRFGWDDQTYNLAWEETVFQNKSLLKPDEVKNKLVLDAGCGNGRYSYWAAQYGGKVIGIDLG